MANPVADCVVAFILVILCGNPILKGAWVTLLNGMLLTLSLEIDIITANIVRLNIINSLTSLTLLSIKALINKVAVDLNLFLGPLQQFSDCTEMSDLNSFIQNSGAGKVVNAYYKKLYDLNRTTNLVNIQTAIKKRKEEQLEKVQDFIAAIASYCP